MECESYFYLAVGKLLSSLWLGSSFVKWGCVFWKMVMKVKWINIYRGLRKLPDAKQVLPKCLNKWDFKWRKDWTCPLEFDVVKCSDSELGEVWGVMRGAAVNQHGAGESVPCGEDVFVRGWWGDPGVGAGRGGVLWNDGRMDHMHLLIGRSQETWPINSCFLFHFTSLEVALFSGNYTKLGVRRPGFWCHFCKSLHPSEPSYFHP